MAEPGSQLGTGTGGLVTPEQQSSTKVEVTGDDDGKVLVKTISSTAHKKERDKWGSKLSYLLTLVGYAVGFGNIWRFPYQMRENGGLVFMIPYCIMLAFVGVPVFFLELAVGQRRRKGLIYAWNEISPWLGGIGMCCGWLCFVVGLYYNTLIAYCLSYFFDSFKEPLPWKNCASATADAAEEAYCNENFPGRSSKYYWLRKTLDISYGIDEAGNYNWYLALYLLMAWSIIWLILWKGTKSVGMVVYFTAVFPYIVLAVFFIFNFFNQPAKGWLGAYRLLLPKWDFLLKPDTWLKAGSQIFFSLGLAYGVLVIFASYNPARNDCHKDAVLISLINCGTSVFAALVVFPIIGVLGYTNYESCIAQMKPIFPGQSMLTAANEHDIYFTTKATKLSDISPSVPLHIRYGYGELSSDSSDWYFKGAVDNQRTDEVIVEITNPADIRYTAALPFPDGLRDCSIGKEATASGSGTGFVFVGFTEAVLHMPCPQLWSFLFFLMLLTLGIDSGFGTVEGSVAAVQDLTNLSRFTATTIVCIILTILAILLFPFGWGVYVLDLLDQWTANWTFLGIAFAECIAVGWLYGLAKIAYDVRLMTGKKPNLFILVCWKYISPLIIVVLLVASVVQYTIDGVTKGLLYSPFQDGADQQVPMPAYAITVGFLLMIFCIVWVPIHIALRNTKYKIIRDDEEPSDFPEEELRDERKINVDREEDQFSTTEKALMGRASIHDLQEHRDKSQTSIPRRESGFSQP